MYVCLQSGSRGRLSGPPQRVIAVPPWKVRALLPDHCCSFADWLLQPPLTPLRTSHFLFCLISWRSGEREHHRPTHTVQHSFKSLPRVNNWLFLQHSRVLANKVVPPGSIGVREWRFQSGWMIFELVGQIFHIVATVLITNLPLRSSLPHTQHAS